MKKIILSFLFVAGLFVALVFAFTDGIQKALRSFTITTLTGVRLESGLNDSFTAFEYHFDDGEGSENPVRDSGDSRHEAQLMNGAYRTGINSGKYGRALELDGTNDYVLIDNRSFFRQAFPSKFHFRVWLYPTDILGKRTIIGKKDVFQLALENGKPSIEVQNVGNITSKIIFSANQWAHLDAAFDGTNLIFQKNGLQREDYRVFMRLSPPINSNPVTIGTYDNKDFFEGRMDDFLWLRGIYGDNRLGNPSQCVSGYHCIEEVVNATPANWNRMVPVRIRTVVNPNICNSAAPCRLLVMIAGGGRCSQYFYEEAAMTAFADEGYIVSSPFVHCEHNENYIIYPQETSLVAKAVEFLRNNSSVSSSINKHLGYYLFGSSHGAIVASLVAFREDAVVPARTWSASSIYDAHDTYHNNPVMPQVFKDVIDRWMGSFDGPHPETAEFLQRFRLWASLDFDDATDVARFKDVVTKREFAGSWGANLAGGACYEENQGFTYSGRKMRNLWESTNPATGWFREIDSVDCRHGLGPIGEFPQLWACVKQFFRDGPQNMPSDWRSCTPFPSR